MNDVDLKLPALFPSSLVVRAFEGVYSSRTVRRRLKQVGAIEVVGGKGRANAHMCIPDVIREEWPSIYERCVELILEQRITSKRR
jgi:hypothetical protein